MLYRAWIGTFLLIIVTLMLGVGGAADVLMSIQEGTLPIVGPGSWFPYAAFWLSALLLAIVLASVTQITGRLKFRAADPRLERRSDQFVVWYSWYILFATLAVIHYAYCFQIVRDWGGIPAVWIAVFILFGLTMSFRRKPLISWRNLFLASAFALAAVFIEQLLWHQPGLWFSVLTPPLIAIVVLQKGRRPFVLPKRLSNRALFLSAVAMLTAVILANVLQSSEDFQRGIWAIGSIGIFFVFISWLACVLAVLTLSFHRIFGGHRFDGALLVILVVAAFVGAHEKTGDEEWAAIRKRVEQVKAADTTVARPPRAELPGEVLQFAIHADGGGLRAALFTAVVLARLDDVTCGEFGSHVFAASGVSGGSLGIATWAVLRQAYVEAGATAWIPCKAAQQMQLQLTQQTFGIPIRQFNPFGSCTQQEPGKNPIPRPDLTCLVFGTLAQDHLSGPLASLLAGDLIWPLGRARRGQALLDSWQGAAIEVLKRYEIASPPKATAFSMDLNKINAGLPSRPPYLLFTATDADQGGRVVFSNAEWRARNISVGVAALNSARFPVISPAGELKDTLLPKAPTVRVVDGGYFDNSGAATLREFLGEAGKLGEPTAKELWILRINGNDAGPNSSCSETLEDYKKVIPYTFIPPNFSLEDTSGGWSGIKAFIKMREAQSEEAASQFRGKYRTERIDLDYYYGLRSCEGQSGDAWNACVANNAAICLVARSAHQAPLSWQLSFASAQRIFEAAQGPVMDFALRSSQ